ncbi:hypothetical protein EF808_04145 [archaeon]|nr:MAG: hypothetical protein EF808_04145 [archaeon]
MVQATLFIEAQANQPGAAMRSLQKMVDDMQSSGVNIVDYEVSDEEKDEVEDNVAYSSFVEMTLEAPLREFLRLCMRVTPSSMEILEGEQEIPANDALYVMGDVCKIIGGCCESAGVRLPMPETQFGDEKQREPGIDEEELHEFLDEGYIHFKFVTKVAGDEDIVTRDILRVLNVMGTYVNKVKLKEDGDQSDGFSGLAAVEAIVPNIETLFEVVLHFSPLAMSIEYPEVLRFTLVDIQNLAINMSSLVTDITNYVATKRYKSLNERR